MFRSFFNPGARSRYLSFFSLSFSFILLSARTAKSTIFFFWLIIIRSGLLAKIRWSICMSKSYRSLCVSFSQTDAGLYIYHLFVWSNLNFLHISQWITLPTQLCLVLYSSGLICCLRLLCNWWFCLYHHITFICYFVAFYLVSIWYESVALCCYLERLFLS